MKKIFLLITCLSLLSCSKDEPNNNQKETFLNVKDFGAIGNDNIDDSDAIIQALAEAKSGEVKKVYLPEGEYKVSKTLYLSSNVTLYGAGALETTIKLAANSSHTLDHIVPIDYEGRSETSGKFRTMISTETADYSNEGQVTENAYIKDLGIDWNFNPSGGYPILPVMLGRSFDSHVVNCKIYDALPGDSIDGYGFSLLFAFAENCSAHHNWIGGADYESVSIRYVSSNTKVYKNTFEINNQNTSQVHAVQIARPSSAFDALVGLRGVGVPKDNFIEENIFLMKKGVGQVFTAHGGDGMYLRNNYVKFFNTLESAWGFKPFAGAVNIIMTDNEFDLTEYENMQTGTTVLSTGTAANHNAANNVVIARNKIYIKNNSVWQGESKWGVQAIIGAYEEKNNENISIHDNQIFIDGYSNNQYPMIACSGTNINVANNLVSLTNPLEPITAEGPAFFHTHGGINMTVTGNNVTGTIGRGFVVTSDEGMRLKNVQVDNEYENCVGEEIILNNHPDEDEVNKTS